MRYSIVIQYDEVDNIYIASIPELQGCFAHGKTQQEALCEISVVYEMWMEEAESSGRTIPEPALYAHAV